MTTRKRPVTRHDPTAAERQARFIEGMHKQGFQRKQIWIRPCDEELGKEHALQGLDGEPPAKCHLPSYLLGYAMNLDPIHRTPKQPAIGDLEIPAIQLPELAPDNPHHEASFRIGYIQGLRGNSPYPLPTTVDFLAYWIGHLYGTVQAMRNHPHPTTTKD